MKGPHYQGGANRDTVAMGEACANFRDLGGLPSDAALVLSQLLLNMGGHAGRLTALALVAKFYEAADVPRTPLSSS